MCWVQSFSPFYSLSLLSLKICSCISVASQNSDTERFNWMIIIHETGCLQVTLFWSRFPLKAEVLYLMQIEIVVIIIQALYSGQVWYIITAWMCKLEISESSFSPFSAPCPWEKIRLEGTGRSVLVWRAGKLHIIMRGPYFSSVATGTIIASLSRSWYYFSFSVLLYLLVNSIFFMPLVSADIRPVHFFDITYRLQWTKENISSSIKSVYKIKNCEFTGLINSKAGDSILFNPK